MRFLRSLFYRLMYGEPIDFSGMVIVDGKNYRWEAVMYPNGHILYSIPYDSMDLENVIAAVQKDLKRKIEEYDRRHPEFLRI
ncbi:MAG: hypothetical protein QXY45_02475 [Candidatus Aenigmatarchaeota archaeon]